MKQKLEVTKVESDGPVLRVTFSGPRNPAAMYGKRFVQLIELPDTQPNRFAYRVGRSVALLVKPV